MIPARCHDGRTDRASITLSRGRGRGSVEGEDGVIRAERRERHPGGGSRPERNRVRREGQVTGRGEQRVPRCAAAADVERGVGDVRRVVALVACDNRGAREVATVDAALVGRDRGESPQWSQVSGLRQKSPEGLDSGGVHDAKRTAILGLCVLRPQYPRLPVARTARHHDGVAATP